MSKERALLKEIIRHFAEGGLAIIASNSDVGKTLHNAQELLAQPEQEFRGLRTNGDSYSQEPVAWKDNNYGNLHHQNWGDPRPLYAAPQKQEPSTSAREMYQRGYAQAELDSKRKQEPLSDDVINDIFVNNQWVTFLTLLEKAQGIGE